MKKIWLVSLMAVLGIALLGTTVFAGWGMGGCGYGGGPGYGAAAGGKPVDVEKFKAFQKETLPLRDEMMTKRVELRNEFLKERPDQNRIATLQREMIDFRAKITTAAESRGLPAFGPGMGGRGHGMGHGWGGHGRRGPGNCPNW